MENENCWFTKLTLLDYPGKAACTIFTSGCNFRCPFCHNASLVVGELDAKIEERELFVFLKKRQGLLDGVCVSGGEPLLQEDIEELIGKIKDLGYLVKLDTNGSLPKKLQSLIDKQLIDYVAMDIKNSKEHYFATSGTDKVPLEYIEESANILMNNKLPYEFRTTVVKELHTAEDFLAISKWLSPASPYFLQAFVDSGDVIGENYHAHSKEDMEHFLGIVRKNLPLAALRGI